VALIVAMQRNDEVNVVTGKYPSIGNAEIGVFEVGEEEKGDRVCPSNIPSERRIASGQPKSILRGNHQYPE
jgi:hypothetical protein